MKTFKTYNRPVCEVRDHKFVHFTKPERVRVLAVAEGWALVRNEWRNTFACSVKRLSEDQPQKPIAP